MLNYGQGHNKSKLTTFILNMEISPLIKTRENAIRSQ